MTWSRHSRRIEPTRRSQYGLPRLNLGLFRSQALNQRRLFVPRAVAKHLFQQLDGGNRVLLFELGDGLPALKFQVARRLRSRILDRTCCPAEGDANIGGSLETPPSWRSCTSRTLPSAGLRSHDGGKDSGRVSRRVQLYDPSPNVIAEVILSRFPSSALGRFYIHRPRQDSNL